MKFRVETLTSNFLCREFDIKHYKELLKCSFGDQPDQEIFCETLWDILRYLTGKKIDEIKSISVVDMLLFVIQLKINSQGSIIKVIVTQDSKKMSMDLNLKFIKDSIIKLYKPYHSNKIVHNQTAILLNFPTLVRLLQPSEENFLRFFDKIVVNDCNFYIKTNSEAEQIFNALPFNLSKQVFEQYKKLFTECKNTDFLQKYKTEESLITTPTIESLLWYTKLLFNEPLDVFYDNMFYLAHYGHIDPKSLNSMNPGEYIYMTKNLQKALSQETTSSSNEGTKDISSEEFDDSGLI